MCNVDSVRWEKRPFIALYDPIEALIAAARSEPTPPFDYIEQYSERFVL